MTYKHCTPVLCPEQIIYILLRYTYHMMYQLNAPINSRLQHPPPPRTDWEFNSKFFPGVGNLTMFRMGRGI